MLHVNDDTNDDLFRKAADDYFLGTNNPDWENVLNKINTGDSSTANEPIINNKKKRFHFLHFFTSSQALLRIFKINSWIEKTKKKINALYVEESNSMAGVSPDNKKFSLSITILTTVCS